jgi:hypothetical protein
MCRSNLGIIIAERTEEDNVQAIRGQCAMGEQLGSSLELTSSCRA